MERKISDLMALRDELGQMLRSCESDKIGECKVIGCLGHHSVVQDLNGCPLVDHPWKEWNGRNGGALLPLEFLKLSRCFSYSRQRFLPPAVFMGPKYA